MVSGSPLLPLLVVLVGTLLYYLGIHFYEDLDEVFAKTKFGEIRGFSSKSRVGRVYSSFYGIPYAKPPVGDLRFQPPVEFGPWKGVLEGTKMSPACTQADLIWGKLDGQEDCLYLNVYTPRTFTKGESREKLYPVLFFIHGGYFMLGSHEMYGPQYFLDEEVVVVTLNYRLGALGFLNTGPEARGNMGLKDQVMALKWVQAGIRDFGGDPDSVTIFGESAGGACVNYHMISPLSERLFKRAISQSGTSLCNWAHSRNTNDAGKRLGKKLGCPIGTTEALMKCLREVDARKIAETQFESEDPFHGPEVIYGPSVDFDTGEDEDVFLYEEPRESAADGQFARVPWMLGVNAEEGCYKTAGFINDEAKLKELHKDWNKVTAKTLNFEEDTIMSRQIKEFYFGKNKNNFKLEDYQALTNMFSDRNFFICSRDAARYHAVNSPTYLYYLSYNSSFSLGHGIACSKGKSPMIIELLYSYLKLNLYKALGLEYQSYGVCHADDLLYLFSMQFLFDISPKSEHYEFSKNLIKLWVSFAKDGRPTDFNGVKWEQVKPDGEIKYLHLSHRKPEMTAAVPFKDRLKFWDSLHL